jgi:hypothetical protein
MDGGEKIKIAPNLGDLEWAKGSFPTKYGVLKVSHSKSADGTVKTEVDAPEGLTLIK